MKAINYEPPVAKTTTLMLDFPIVASGTQGATVEDYDYLTIDPE